MTPYDIIFFLFTTPWAASLMVVLGALVMAAKA
jgi:hypothetical protein